MLDGTIVGYGGKVTGEMSLVEDEGVVSVPLGYAVPLGENVE